MYYRFINASDVNCLSITDPLTFFVSATNTSDWGEHRKLKPVGDLAIYNIRPIQSETGKVARRGGGGQFRLGRGNYSM